MLAALMNLGFAGGGIIAPTSGGAVPERNLYRDPQWGSRWRNPTGWRWAWKS